MIFSIFYVIVFSICSYNDLIHVLDTFIIYEGTRYNVVLQFALHKTNPL